ncbi:UDP glycosyltransferase 89A2 [Hibiscus trionum]|uniref:UDP glycosyltransferase 89A2 n=1 Tax=Hibiscus trionum TaxID=183268 RepID=A0A9W7J7T0_HIBTR|nr:UDP glycosyltransferase 89A2 [Hibiscus trionum]
MSTADKCHILVFPFPAQGHMLPLLHLTHRLSLHGLTITVVVTPQNLSYLSPLPSSITPLVLPFPSHPSIPPGVENVKDLAHSGNLPMPNSTTLYSTGSTLTPTRLLAFFPSGAFFASIDDYIWNNVQQLKPLDEVELSPLPGSPVFKSCHLPSLFRLYVKSDPDWEIVKDLKLANTKSWGFVFNSFEAMEGEYMDYLKKTLNHDRIFRVGPLNLAGLGNSGSGSNPNDRVLTWLDGCPKESVVYVCFGSQKLLKRDQIEALAVGLEKSGTRFVWVVKTGKQGDGFGIVPDGFEERVAGRGMVIREWVSQVSILSHEAVGGFLSHCGWNSVLEGVVGGVMILAWPMEADQFVNARLLVEEMRVAVRVCEGHDSVPDPDELGRVIGESMREMGGLKGKAKELKERALEAVTNEGSSVRNLVRFVGKLRKLQSHT